MSYLGLNRRERSVVLSLSSYLSVYRKEQKKSPDCENHVAPHAPAENLIPTRVCKQNAREVAGVDKNGRASGNAVHCDHAGVSGARNKRVRRRKAKIPPHSNTVYGQGMRVGEGKREQGKAAIAAR